MILYKEIWRTLDPPLASSRSQVRESADVTKYRANLCQNVLGKYIYSWEKIDFRSICGNVLLDYSSVRD